MSTEAPAALEAAKPRRQAWLADLRSVRVLRYALGVTTAVAIAFSYAWPLYFLTPVFAAVLLALPVPRPQPSQLFASLGQSAVAFALGLFFTLFLHPYPLAYVLALGLVLFHIYYHANRGGSIWLVLMCLIAVFILPMLGSAHEELPLAFALYFAASSVLAIAINFVSHVVVPDPAAVPAPPSKRAGSGYSPAAAVAALKSTLVMLPMAVLFIALEWSSQILVLIYAGVFSLAPDVSAGKASGAKSMKSTLLGGIAAVVVYGLILAVPEIHFFVPLMFLVLLLFGAGIFSDHPSAKYLGSAVTALIILVSSVTAEGASITDALLIRILLIAAATLYVVTALAVLERFIFGRRA